MVERASFDVIVCGSLHLDIVVNAPALPRIDETAVGTSWQKICGGKGGNQAVQAARAGASTAMIGRVGDDDFGRMLRAHLDNQSVNSSAVKTDVTTGSGMSVAILQDDGNYGAVIVSGANLAIDTQELEQQWRELGGCNILALQNEVPAGVNLTMAKIATDAGALVVLNAAPARELAQDLLEQVGVLVVNRIEAEAMCGVPISSRASARMAIRSLSSTTRSAVVTLGGDGLVVCTSSGEITDIEPILVQVTSTHGAGDCFVGTLCAQLAAGQPLLSACEVANYRAAQFVSRRHFS